MIYCSRLLDRRIIVGIKVTCPCFLSLYPHTRPNASAIDVARGSIVLVYVKLVTKSNAHKH